MSMTVYRTGSDPDFMTLYQLGIFLSGNNVNRVSFTQIIEDPREERLKLANWAPKLIRLVAIYVVTLGSVIAVYPLFVFIEHSRAPVVRCIGLGICVIGRSLWLLRHQWARKITIMFTLLIGIVYVPLAILCWHDSWAMVFFLFGVLNLSASGLLCSKTARTLFEDKIKPSSDEKDERSVAPD